MHRSPALWNESIARMAGEVDHLPAPAGSYLTPAGILRHFDRQVRGHDGHVLPIGTSIEGRPIWAFRFGGPARGGTLLVSLLHACEWVGALALIALVDRILQHEPAEPITVLPVANPDGVARAMRSAARLLPRYPRGNAAGVDLNRNFPPGRRSGFWGTTPWVRGGPAAGSEPESTALLALARAVRPSCAISFHSFGRRIFYPPAGSRIPWPSTVEHRTAIDRAGGAEAIGYRSGQLGRWASWFRAHGTEIDFLAGEIGARAYLIEVSWGGIGRWGVRRSALPFFAFNPPAPEEEITRLAGFCERLIAEARG